METENLTTYTLKTAKISNSDIPETVKFDLITGHIIDLREKGKVSSESEKYPQFLGCNVKVKFDLGPVTIHDTQEVIQLKGEIPFLNNWETPKDLKGNVASFVLKGDEDRARKYSREFMEHHKISMKGEHFHEKQIDTESYLFAVSVCPPGLTFEELLPLTLWGLFGFHSDDIMDNSTDMPKEELSKKQVFRAFDTLCNILNGQQLNHEYPDLNQMPKFDKLCQIYSDFREMLLKCEKFPGEANYFISSYMINLSSVAWESAGWTSSNESGPMDIHSYLALGTFTIGHNVLLEMTSFLHHETLDKKIRKDPLLKYLKVLWAKYGRLLNDMFSLPKEIKNGENLNYILLRAKESESSGSQCLEDLVQNIFPQLKKKINTAAKQLLFKYKEDEELKRYLQRGNRAIDGAICWTVFSKRYNLKHEDVEIVFTE